MRHSVVLLLLLILAASAAQDEINPELAEYGAEIALLCAENGLSGRVAWVSDRDGDPEIYLMDLDVGYPHRVTAFAGDDRRPALSPDGKHLAWVSEMGGRADIYLMELGPSGRGRGWRRLTDTPGVERDLSWSADGERIYFSSFEVIDFESVGLEDVITRELEYLDGWRFGYAAYCCDLSSGAVERLSLFPGDFRWPVHVAGLGVVCVYEPWSAEVSPFSAGLVLIHHALACDPYEPAWLEEAAVIEGLRRYPDGELLLAYRVEEVHHYARFEPLTVELIVGWPSARDYLNLAPDPNDAESGWLIGQTDLEGDAASEVVLIGGLNSTVEPMEIFLTRNECYDGEPSWATREE